MEPRTFGINAMLADMQPLLQRVVGDGVELAFVQAAGLWPVRLPPGRLEEVVLALAIEACEAMPQGGTLTVETANVARRAGKEEADRVMLSLADTGRSVGSAVRAVLAGQPGRSGAARGLFLAHELAEASGGSVDIEPAKGGGTAVRLFFARADTPVAARDAGAPALAGGSETILLVEDEKSLINVASRVLSRLGYTLLVASTADAALRQLAGHQGPIHLLLTDMMLPDKDGVALAREVTARRPQTRVLFMSGYSEEALRLRSAVGAGYRLLEKPFTLEGLAAAVRQALA